MTQHFQPGVLDLSREAIQQNYGIPEIPLEIPPPGFYRADLLQWSYKGLLPSGSKPWDRTRCCAIRAEQGDRFLSWAFDSYTWDQFLGEVNWISDDEALTLLEMLLERDILHEMRSGILRGNSIENTPRSKRLPELERMLAWIRTGNRWAWWIDALQGIPDPKYHPIPRLDFSMHGPSFGVDRVRRHIEDVSKLLFRRGIGNEGLLAMADYILYALGFLSEPPDNVPAEAFRELVISFDIDLLLRRPSSHFDTHLSESKIGRQAAFFSTPMNVSVFMSEMVHAAFYNDEASDLDESVLQRKRKLCSALGEPAAGTGNLILASSNHHWLGGPFWDINPSIKKVGRAQLALYAPWLAQYYFLAPPPYGSLADPEELRQHATEQQKMYIIEPPARSLRHGGLVSPFRGTGVLESKHLRKDRTIREEKSSADKAYSASRTGAQHAQDEESIRAAQQAVEVCQYSNRCRDGRQISGPYAGSGSSAQPSEPGVPTGVPV